MQQFATTTNTTSTTTTTITTTTSTKTNSESRESEEKTITTGKLFDPGRWNLARRSNSQILPQLEKHNSPSLAFADSQRGIPNTILETPNSLEDSSSPSQYIGTTRNRIGDTEILDSGDYREEQQPSLLQSIPIEIFHHTRTDEEETDPGLQEIKPIHPSPTFQNGRGACIKRTYRKRRLHGKIRSQRRLHCSTNPPKLKTVSGIPASRNNLQLQGVKLRVKYSPKDFFKTTKIRPRTIEKRRYSLSLFSRRYLHIGSREGKIAEVSRQDHETSGIIRFHYKQKQECTNTIACSRLPRVHLRYQEDDNQGTREEDNESASKIEASPTGDNEVMQMGGKLNGEDDGNDSGSGRSSSTHPLPTEGPDKIVDGTPPKLGEVVLLVTTSEGGNPMVADMPDGEKRIAHTKNTVDSSSDHHLHGQLGYRLGSGIDYDEDPRILDRGREEVVHQRKRTDGHLFCTKAPCTKVQKQNNKTVYGQQNLNQVYNEIRGHCFSNPSGYCDKNSGTLQSIPNPSNISTCKGDSQHRSRQSVEEETTAIREESIEENFSGDTNTLGTVDSGHVCQQTQSSTTPILQSQTRPGSESDRRLPTKVAKEDGILLSTMETNSDGSETHQTTTTGEGDSSYSGLANTILVSHAVEHDAASSPYVLPSARNELGRMAIIRQARRAQGLATEETDFLEACIRESTAKAYDNGVVSANIIFINIIK